MIKLVAMLKRRDGMTTAEFHDYWRTVHGPLVAGTDSGAYALRYEQHHRLAATYGGASAPDEYDGVTVQWFRSLADFQASVQTADYADIAADLPKFLDLAALRWMLTDEPELVVGRGESLPDGASGSFAP